MALIISSLLISCGIKENSLQNERKVTESVESNSKKTGTINDGEKNSKTTDKKENETRNCQERFTCVKVG